jgi:hypothetical protein
MKKLNKLDLVSAIEILKTQEEWLDYQMELLQEKKEQCKKHISVLTAESRR